MSRSDRDWLSLLALPSPRPARARWMEELRDVGSPDRWLNSDRVDAVSPAIRINHRRVDEWLEVMQRLAHGLIPFLSPRFPSSLFELSEPPLLLFTRGRSDPLDAPKVAVVGSRKPTLGGQDLARCLAEELAGAGFAVVSGLAVGIDAAAHRGAMAAEGETIAVLGNGLDVAYPRGNRALQEEIANRGLLLGEYPPGTLPMRHRFPERNRIVSALSQGVVVVEAGERSGALHTAREAETLGRPVFAVPGSPGSPECAGCNQLLKRGRATLVESAEDVILALEGIVPRAGGAIDPPSSPSPRKPSSRLWNLLGTRGAEVDLLARRLDQPVPRVLEELLRLELRGDVESVSGGSRWRRRVRPETRS